jgi:hypothetical protein
MAHDDVTRSLKMPRATHSQRSWGTPNPEPNLDRFVQHHIGRQLRSLYDGLVDQPVPDRFAELIDRLDEDESSREETRA